jgi:predicted negative regulator of RcsB-dependent stress response
MANQRKKGKDPAADEDVFVEKTLQLAGWVQKNSEVVAVGAAVAVILVLGGLYYQNYRQGLSEEASARYQQLAAELQTGAPPDTVAARLQGFLTSYEGTQYADRARLLLARIALANDRWDEALGHLEPLSGLSPDTPVGYSAGVLRAAALEGAGRTEEALDVLSRLSERARFAYQQREAAADRARLLVNAGRLEEAADIYARLAEETPEDAPDAGNYALRLGEVQAALSSSDGS